MEQFAVQRIFGTQMVARLEMERQILSNFQRLPALESSFVGLEAVMGTDEDIDFEDYLNGMCSFPILLSRHRLYLLSLFATRPKNIRKDTRQCARYDGSQIGHSNCKNVIYFVVYILLTQERGVRRQPRNTKNNKTTP